MKFLNVFASAGFILAFAFTSFSQIQEIPAKPSQSLSHGKKFNHPIHQSSGNRLVEYWSEDFSNGLNGQDTNGLWTVSGVHGNLWIQTFPQEIENGYNGDLPLEGYGEYLPNYWNEREILYSESRSNGVIMIDADRYNSLSTMDLDGETTLNPIDAQLISPSIDLTGIDQALLNFSHYFRLCCENGSVNLDFSTDGGENWIDLNNFDGYASSVDVEEYYSLNISNELAAATDLTNCKIRFNFPDTDSHYFWMIDDISITSLNENDLVAGETFYNDYHKYLERFENGTVDASQYYKGFEYSKIPTVILPTLKLAMVVTNNGSEVQTGVQLKVTPTFPSGFITSPLTSDPIDLESGVTDTLEIDEISYTDISPILEVEEGDYAFSYEVVQNEFEELPLDNIGQGKSNNVNIFYPNTDHWPYGNGGINCEGTYTEYGQDVIWSSTYGFKDQGPLGWLHIKGVELVFFSSDNIAETSPGQIIYLNVREGNIFEENPDDPDTYTSVFFDSENRLEYSSLNEEYTINSNNIWNAGSDEEYPWDHFFFESPILIEGGKVYSAEFRVPASSSGMVYPVICSDQELYSSYMYSFSDSTWYHLGNNAVQMRFMVDYPENIDEISSSTNLLLHQNYPNPATEQTHIKYQLKESGDVNFELTDIHGKLIFSEKLGNVPAQALQTYDLDMSELASGMYFYSILQNGERISRKLIAQ